jgi:hypothetical protein
MPSRFFFFSLQILMNVPNIPQSALGLKHAKIHQEATNAIVRSLPLQTEVVIQTLVARAELLNWL